MAAEAGVEINGVSVAAKPAPSDPNASPDAQGADLEADGTDAADRKPAGRSGERLRGLLNGAAH